MFFLAMKLENLGPEDDQNPAEVFLSEKSDN